MRKLLLAVALFLYAVPALGQQVRQTGVVTPGHAPVWATQGVVGDGGTAQNGAFTSLGVTNNGGPGVCVNSAPASSGNYNQICLAASTAGGGTLSLSNVGTATGTLSFVVNGSPLALPVVGLPTATNDAACFSNTAGALFRCNGQMALRGTGSGIVTIAVQAAAGTFNFNLPTASGSAGQVLTSGGGAGAPMTWTNPSGSPGGSNTQVQFNNSSSFGGSAAFTWASPTLTVGAAGTGTGVLALKGTTSGTISIQPQAVAGTYNFNMPTTAGTAGQVLTSQGGGASVMTWSTPVASAAGSDTQVQFNSTGSFGASANLTWVSPKLTIGTAGATTGQLALAGSVSGTTTLQPANTTTGTLTVPSGTDTLVARATTDILSNKSFATGFGLNGSSSGTITVQTQAAAGTYNWNMPTSAGTANGPLLSGGGGATAMTFGTRASSGGGATTVFATVSGTLTSGNCITTDSFLNIADAGAACGSGGGGGGPPAATVKDYIAGVDFTAGTTTSLVLPTTPAAANIVQILFDGVVQSHNTWSLSTATVTFNAAIPLNVQVVEASYYTGGGSSSSPGGVTGNVQYNNGGVFGGLVSTQLATSGTLFKITSQIAANIPFAIQGAAAQSGNLQEWRSSVPAILASVDAAGVIRGSSGGVFSTLTDTALSIAGPVLTNASGLLSSVAVLTAPNGGTGNAGPYTNGQLLIGNTGTGLLNAATLTAGSGITITNTAGGITVAATASGISGPGTSSQGGSATWLNTTGTALANGKGACNIRAFGADEAASAAVNTAAIQNAINTCGMIYIPAPAGGQTYDSNAKPSFCYKVSSTLTWSTTKNGGAVGDGPSVSCVSQTSASICVMNPQHTTNGYWANITIRHDVGVTPTAGGCGIDFGAITANSTVTAFNLQVYNNYDGAILGATDLSTWIGGFVQYNVNDGLLMSSNTNNTQWNIVGGTLLTNNGNSHLHIKCQVSGTTAPNLIDGLATFLAGGNSIDVDGSVCNIDNFRITNSFLGESGLNHIKIHSGGVTPYVIDNVLFESPGFTCTAGNVVNNCNNNLAGNTNCLGGGGAIIVSSGAAATTAPIHINNAVEFGCGAPFPAQFGVWILNSSDWTITNSTFMNNAGAGIRVSDGVGYLAGNRTFNNGTFGIFADSTTIAITTIGNHSGSNNSSGGAGSPNATASGVVGQSHTGDWCGTLTSVVACTWP